MAKTLLTYRDYAALPDDGRRHELHDGELSVTPAPTPRHQIVIGNFADVLRAHVRATGAGLVLFAPLDVILSPTTVVQPDLVYLDPTRLGQISGRGIEGPPTLVIEVLSPSTAAIDRQTKRRLYARHGVPYFWLVDPEARAVEALVLESQAYVLAVRASGAAPVSPPPFTGLALVPATLWE